MIIPQYYICYITSLTNIRGNILALVIEADIDSERCGVLRDDGSLGLTWREGEVGFRFHGHGDGRVGKENKCII